VLILSDYVAVILWRGQWDLRTVRLLLPGTLAGVALAWGMLVWVQDSRAAMTRADAFLKLTVGLIALGFVVLQVLRALRGRPLTVSPGLAHATGVGAAAGATSTFAHAAGPVMAMYLLGQRMEPGKYVATTAVYFWLVNQIKLAPYFHLGMIDLSSLGFSLLLAPAAVAGTFLGVYLQRRLGQRQFTGVVYTLLAAAGVDLCLRGGWALGHSLRLW